jgi:hypothetical protein
MATSRNALLPIGAGTLTQALVGTADVSDELGRAGMSLGKFVEFTGKAVADTQLRLNQTGAAMASTLATTKVDVIAVQENIYDDDGRLDESVSYTRQLPLINFIDPVFYEWTAVRLQGFFFARELVASSEANSSQFSSSTGLFGAGVSFILGPGAMAFNDSTTRTSSDIDTTQDTSFGNIRASALLEPKRDIGVPPPRQVVRGPSLGVVAGDIQDVMNGAVLAGRTMSVLLQLRRSDGSGIEGKAISIDSEGAPWSFTDPALTTTDAAGDLRITLRRDFVGDTPDTAPADVVLTARLGLVSNSETLTF